MNYYNQSLRDTNNYQGILWKIICQQIGQPGRNGQIPEHPYSSKTQSGGNRKLEQTHNQRRNWIGYQNLPTRAPRWRSRLSVRLQPGHDLAVCEFEPHVRLWADGSEPGACFWFCVSLSLCPSPVHALSLSVPKMNKRWKKIKKKISQQIRVQDQMASQGSSTRRLKQR